MQILISSNSALHVTYFRFHLIYTGLESTTIVQRAFPFKKPLLFSTAGEGEHNPGTAIEKKNPPVDCFKFPQ